MAGRKRGSRCFSSRGKRFDIVGRFSTRFIEYPGPVFPHGSRREDGHSFVNECENGQTVDVETRLSTRADTPPLGGESGKALTVYDGCENEVSHALENASSGSWRSIHGANPGVIKDQSMGLKETVKRMWQT